MNEPIIIGDHALYHGDCLEVMKELSLKGIKVDMVLTDPPYGTTACKWDNIIPFEAMWQCVNSLVKDNGAIALFGSEPFSSMLRCSNLKMFKYDWIYTKTKGTNYLQAKRMPIKNHEIISVFYREQSIYNPQYTKGEPYKKTHRNGNKDDCTYRKDTRKNGDVFINDGYRFPTSVIEKISNPSGRGQLHPTQKPVPLLEYLIKTYTNEGDTVLDFTAGSFSTGIACINTKRKFIGIELDDKYFEIGRNRMENHKKQVTLEDLL